MTVPPDPSRHASLAARLRVYMVTPPGAISWDVVRGAVRGGVTAIQLRMPSAPVSRLLEDGGRLRRECPGVFFVVNNRVDVALALDADGVHLGADDLDVATVRGLAPDLVIGATVRDASGARKAIEAGADYLGLGAIYESPTKEGSPVVGLDGIAAVVRAAGEVPVVAIGGIVAGMARDPVQRGAAGVAVVGALDTIDGPEAEKTARVLLDEVHVGLGIRSERLEDGGLIDPPGAGC